ncbi:hypothetical protein Hanom_Chr03g00261881 [Helianthus anomalus]
MSPSFSFVLLCTSFWLSEDCCWSLCCSLDGVKESMLWFYSVRMRIEMDDRR